MFVRILIAGIVGGILMFMMGAVGHMVFQLQSRAMAKFPDEKAFVEQVKGHNLKPGMYDFPAATPEAQSDTKAYEALNERYKAGPSGLLLIMPTGEDMMGPQTLAMELIANTLAALLAAWIVSLLPANVNFFQRWGVLFLMGVIGWLSLTASYGIWYRFPPQFVHDELYCAMLEWAVAGAAIAAIVRRPAVAPPVK